MGKYHFSASAVCTLSNIAQDVAGLLCCIFASVLLIYVQFAAHCDLQILFCRAIYQTVDPHPTQVCVGYSVPGTRLYIHSC